MCQEWSQGRLLHGRRENTITMHCQQNHWQARPQEPLTNILQRTQTQTQPFSTQEHSCTRLPRVWLKSHGQVQLGWELCLWLETSHPSSDSHSLANSTVSWANVQGSKAGTTYRAGREEAFALWVLAPRLLQCGWELWSQRGDYPNIAGCDSPNPSLSSGSECSVGVRTGGP